MVAEIDCKTGEPVIRERPILEQFCYEGGYTLALTDLASQGVKVEILHPDEALWLWERAAWWQNSRPFWRGSCRVKTHACRSDKATRRDCGRR